MKRATGGAWAVVLPAALCAVMLLGCSDDDELDYAPWDCQHDKPGYGWLNVSVTINQAYPRVPIIVYRGEWEENDEIMRDTLDSDHRSYELPSDQDYTVLAMYILIHDTLATLDADNIAIDSTEYIDAVCYEVDDADVDCRLP